MDMNDLMFHEFCEFFNVGCSHWKMHFPVGWRWSWVTWHHMNLMNFSLRLWQWKMLIWKLLQNCPSTKPLMTSMIDSKTVSNLTTAKVGQGGHCTFPKQEHVSWQNPTFWNSFFSTWSIMSFDNFFVSQKSCLHWIESICPTLILLITHCSISVLNTHDAWMLHPARSLAGMPCFWMHSSRNTPFWMCTLLGGGAGRDGEWWVGRNFQWEDFYDCVTLCVDGMMKH